MQRIPSPVRPNWRERVERVGFSFHTADGPYWDEAVRYELTAAEVDQLESTAAELHRLCLQAVEVVIRDHRFAEFRIPKRYIPLVLASWERREPALYGRFDLAYHGTGPAKLYEYNADTPTSILEAAVVQWEWLEEVAPEADQFNSLHERLIARWQLLHPGRLVHFACVHAHEEDLITTVYLEDTAAQAGLKTKRLFMHEIGWDGERFVDLQNIPIDVLFKLYPWEWLINEPFSPNLLRETCRLIEPAWKMILSNKALLPLLWEMFPGHPNLLPAYFTPELLGTEYARKPILGREGANVLLAAHGESMETPGQYGEAGYIYQALHVPPCYEGKYPVIGAWMIGDEAGGLGIRESDSPITGNTSRFVPHLFR